MSLFSYGNIISIIYIFFLQFSQSVANPARQERENMQKGPALLSPATWIRSVPVAVGSWGACGGEGCRGKRMLLKKIK